MKAKFTLIVLIFIALIAACVGLASAETPATASKYPMTITDSFDRTANLTKAPERIISLSPANTEILFALGLGSKVVGNTEYDDYPAEALNITHVSGFSTLSYEKITAANPDLIVAEDIVGEEAVNKLRGMGFSVIEVKNSDISSVKKNIRLIGLATDTEANATALINDMEARLANISSVSSGLPESQKPTVLLLAGYLQGLPIYVYGEGTYGDELITLAGGRNAAAGIKEYQVMSSEAIIKADPDFIIIPVDGTMTTVKDLESFRTGNESWMKDLKAVKNGHVVMVDGNLMMHPGPRLTQAGQVIATEIRPVATATQAPTATATATPGFEAAVAFAALICVVRVATRDRK